MFVEVLRGRGVVLLRFQEELEVRERSGRGPGGVRERSRDWLRVVYMPGARTIRIMAQPLSHSQFDRVVRWSKMW